jgi:hypothetical protein
LETGVNNTIIVTEGSANPLVSCVASVIGVLRLGMMDEKDFKKHLRDLAHGHHHPEEHDWAPDASAAKADRAVGTKRSQSSGRSVRTPKRRKQGGKS